MEQRNNEEESVETTKTTLRDILTSRRIPLIIVLVITGFFMTTMPIMAWSLHTYYEDKLLPKTVVGNMTLGGLTLAEAETQIDARADEIMQRGIVVRLGETEVIIPSEYVSLDPDLPITDDSTIFTIDASATTRQAYKSGREYAPGSIVLAVQSLITPTTTPAVYTLDEEAVKEILTQELTSRLTLGHDATFGWDKDARQITITPELKGETIDYAGAITQIRAALASLTAPRVVLATSSDTPQITTLHAQTHIATAQEIVSLAPLTLTTEGKQWTVSPETLTEWLTIEKSGNATTLALDRAKVQDFLKDTIASRIDIPEETPRFQLKNGVITKVQQAKKGRTLDLEASYETIRHALLEIKHSSIALTVHTEQTGEEITIPQNELLELVGSGTSDFKGSPTNRVTNIKVAMAKIQGMVIKPGEEFSMITALGNIDASGGYVPELVIKGNKTIPEYGGGVCQVSSTLFRSAIHAGLPITERRNHSYAVSYYNPIGFDATIYDPKPDFRFKNDTGNLLLIQVKIEGTILTVELWGKKDGRKVEVEKPRLYNVVKVGKEKLIESTELKPGEKKCSGTPRDGMDAIFSRTITRPDGEQVIESFKSHYIPWPATCLIGKSPDKVSEVSPEAPTGALTSTSADTANETKTSSSSSDTPSTPGKDPVTLPTPPETPATPPDEPTPSPEKAVKPE